MMQYEASALGINMSVPYGAWMGSVIEDSFWAPHDLIVEIQDFITGARAALLDGDLLRGRGALQHPERVRLGGASGSEGAVPVLATRATASSSSTSRSTSSCCPEGKLREDWVTAKRPRAVRTVVLPECSFLTPAQVEALRGYLEHGGP